MIEWFLVLSVMSCGNCYRAIELAMPSLEVCRVVRDLNSGSKCITTDGTQGDPMTPLPTPEGKRKAK